MHHLKHLRSKIHFILGSGMNDFYLSSFHHHHQLEMWPSGQKYMDTIHQTSLNGNMERRRWEWERCFLWSSWRDNKWVENGNIIGMGMMMVMGFWWWWWKQSRDPSAALVAITTSHVTHFPSWRWHTKIYPHKSQKSSGFWLLPFSPRRVLPPSSSYLSGKLSFWCSV